MAPSTALERFNRALDLIPFVEANPGWTIQELAVHFGTTASEISKDLATLHMCGLPGYSHLELIDLSYDDDLVTILNSQNLSTPRDLTVDERLAILLGLEMMKGLTSATPMLEKISALQARFQNVAVAEISKNVDLTQAVNHAPFREILINALEQGAQLDIEYVSGRSNAISTRHIAPISLYQIGDHLYAKAFCFSSQSVRHFRCDRMKSCAISAEMKSLPHGDFSPEEEGSLITVLLESSARHFLEEHRHLIVSQEAMGEGILAKFAISDTDWLAKALLALPSPGSILEPISAMERQKELAAEILALYS